jgi:hypothetical protein
VCDYSLSVASRPAVEGERLVLKRFPTVLRVSWACPISAGTVPRTSPWTRLRQLCFPETPCAVCLPSGAKLTVRDLPLSFRRASPDGDDNATFVQGGQLYSRDAIRLRDGSEVLLQRLAEGQIVDVLSLSAMAPVGVPAELFEQEPVRN